MGTRFRQDRRVGFGFYSACLKFLFDFLLLALDFLASALGLFGFVAPSQFRFGWFLVSSLADERVGLFSGCFWVGGIFRGGIFRDGIFRDGHDPDHRGFDPAKFALGWSDTKPEFPFVALASIGFTEDRNGLGLGEFGLKQEFFVFDRIGPDPSGNRVLSDFGHASAWHQVQRVGLDPVMASLRGANTGPTVIGLDVDFDA